MSQQSRKYYVAAQGLVTHRFQCTGRKLRLARVLDLTEAEAAELGALSTVRRVEAVPSAVVLKPALTHEDSQAAPPAEDTGEATSEPEGEDGAKGKKRARRASA